MTQITDEMINAGVNATGMNFNGRPLWKCAIDDQVREIYKAMEAVRPKPQTDSIYPPNDSGSTQCIVKWMVDTPHGWVGAWNKNAIEYLVGTVE